MRLFTMPPTTASVYPFEGLFAGEIQKHNFRELDDVLFRNVKAPPPALSTASHQQLSYPSLLAPQLTVGGRSTGCG